jgi:ESS family glutamate:Na+ symporter
MIEYVDGGVQVGEFLALTVGIVVLFIGKRLNSTIGFLRDFSSPEPVTGGLILSILFGVVYGIFGIEVSFDLSLRDLLLIYFFTTIGINASLKDLIAGGKPLAILVVITISYMFIQNLTGIGITSLFDLKPQNGVIAGTVSLIGGHGTAIAWAPKIAEGYGIGNAMELGIACATLGLILASIQGGPIARLLIKRYDLKPSTHEPIDVGLEQNKQAENVGQYDFLDAILAIHICAILGSFLNELLEGVGLDLPLFVTCLFAGILVSNLLPKNFPRWSGRAWPSRTPAMALIADMSLGTFLAMSLMSMQLWTIFAMAGPILAVMAAQVVIALLINLFIVFPAMGKNYDAAVICSGFGGISLGSTPTAMANMSAVTQRFGPSHLAFIVVPLVCAFFIDLANAFIIPFFLNAF